VKGIEQISVRIYCNTLQRTPVYRCKSFWEVLSQKTAKYCNKLQHDTLQESATQISHCNTEGTRNELCISLRASPCNTLQHAATHCNTQQHAATHYNKLPHISTQCNTMQQAATRCNTPQHVATRCNTLQRTATHCNTLPYTATLQHRYLLSKKIFCRANLDELIF